MNKLQSLVLAITLCIVSVSVATAQDFDKGLDAYNAGDYQTALQEWRPLAEQGNAAAQFSLGQLYYHGKGVLQDYAQALMWYQRATNQGFVHGQNRLGMMYAQGIGVPQDYAEALKWYGLAAKQGSAMAQERLGMMYARGQGILRNDVIAHMWTNIASANGDPDAGRIMKIIARLMTQADISKAQQMARECMSSNYQNCGE